jgi:hypothetical protein
MSAHSREALLAFLCSCLLAVVLTWPLAARLGSAGRVDSGDGRHGMWNVAWVAHALTTDPGTLFDANIFFPQPNTLVYSEANLLAGVMGIPVWLMTGGNPYATFNSVVLMAFVLATMCAYALARTIGAGRAGAATGAIIYAFCPFMFAHLPHIQLLMTFGPALSLLAMHRFAEAPTLRRGAAMGLALAVTGLGCAYYGIFSALVVSLGVVWFGVTDGHWRRPGYWLHTATGVVVVSAIMLPLFIPYLEVRDAGFARTLEEARLYSTTGAAYLASPMWVHRWILPFLESWREVLFPGFVAVLFGVAAVVLARRVNQASRWRMVGFYLAVCALSFWISLGPDGGLYSLLYHSLPAFSFLRAPVRMGLLVTLGTAMLTALSVTWLRRTHTRLGYVIGTAAVAGALVESVAIPLTLANAPSVPAVYKRLAAMPRGAVVEFPFYQGPEERHRQTEYMLLSTFHWQPLVNGYSDHFPARYLQAKPALVSFPSPESLEEIRTLGVRWVVVHFNRYTADERRRLRPVLRALPTQLRLVIDRPDVSLYEVIWTRPPVDRPQP